MALLLAAVPAVAAEIEPARAVSDALAPETLIRVSEPRPSVSKPFFVEVEISWPDGVDRLLPHPPRFTFPEGFSSGELAASTHTSGGRSVVVYRQEVTAAKPGIHALEPVEIRWTLEPERTRWSRRVDMPELTVVPSLSGTSLSSGPAASGGLPAGRAGAATLLGLALGGAVALTWIRRRKKKDPAETRDCEEDRAVAARARLEELFRQARRLRLDHLPGEAMEVFEQILGELEAESPLSRERVEEMRYGGNPPRSEELDLLELWAHREVEALRPSVDRPREEALRPRDRVAVQ